MTTNPDLAELSDAVIAVKVLNALQGEGGTVIRTTFDERKEEALRTALARATSPAAPPPPAA